MIKSLFKKNELCPECGSSNIYYDEKSHFWICNTCHFGFKGPIGNRGSRRQGRTDVILKPGESVIREAKVKETLRTRASGILTLTNSRLLFEEITGILSKKREILWSAPLSSIRSVGLEGLFSKSLVIEISWRETQVRRRTRKYKFSIAEAGDWESAIRSAVRPH